MGKLASPNFLTGTSVIAPRFAHIQGTNQYRPRDATAALIKRLAHRNANVQLYTLELANAFSQNCGPRMHRELASRSFTDTLLRLAGDKVPDNCLPKVLIRSLY